MPSLTAFGLSWNIGSDDFVFPEITEAFVRIVWTAFALTVFLLHYPLTCTVKDLNIYIAALLIIQVITIIIALVTAHISGRGAIMNPQPRYHVVTMLYIRCPVFLLEVVWTVLAGYHAFKPVGNETACNFTTIMRVTLVLEFALIICVILGAIAVFTALQNIDDEDMVVLTRRNWSRRFRIFKIRQDARMRAAVDDLANLAASFFVEGDYVASDVAAGLLLVVHSPANVYPPIISISSGRPSWMTVESALHFLHFSSCVYGWPTYLFHNCGVRPYCRLLGKLQCCGRLRCDQLDVEADICVLEMKSKPPGSLSSSMSTSHSSSDRKKTKIEKVLVIEDNCCFCNTAAFLLSTETRNIDVFFVSFRNNLYEVPFVVLSDHDSKSVVITIRGSCSISDLVTDLCLDDEVLSVDVDADPVLRSDASLDGSGEVRVHRGMLRSARYVYDALKKHNILEDMFVLNPSYNLVVCGHSLGAGVAALLTLLLKQQFPDVHCYAFSPPGCVISENGLEEMQQHVMAVVGGDDVVSRISYHAMHRLREKVQQELATCQKAKYEILIRGIFRLFFQEPWTNEPLSGLPEPSDSQDDTVLIRGTSQGYGSALTTAERLSVALSTRTELFAPGKILYVHKSEEGDEMMKQWIDARCLNDVKLSASAFADHLPKNLMKMMEQLVEQSNNTPEVIVVEPVSSNSMSSSVQE